MKVFWDTNLFIYMIEGHEEFCVPVEKLYKETRDKGGTIVTSALTLGELIAQPLRRGKSELAARYTDILSGRQEIEIAVFDREAGCHYGRIRAETTVKQPDAIQLACALSAGATEFFTNDKALWDIAVPGIERIRGVPNVST